jgi:hypothetical protein
LALNVVREVKAAVRVAGRKFGEVEIGGIGRTKVGSNGGKGGLIEC